jgi:hypothetical protein
MLRQPPCTMRADHHALTMPMVCCYYTVH